MSMMLSFLLLILIGSSTLGQLNEPFFLLNHSHHFQNKEYHNNDSVHQNINSLEEAIKVSEKFIEKIKNYYGMPSLVFSISVKGKKIWEKSWGFVDLENNVNAKITTKYRIASISKTFTSTLIGKLIDQGKIKYQDPVSKYLKNKDFPAKTWNKQPVNLTISDLLTHTAGTHVTQLYDFDNVVPGINCTQMIHKFKKEPLHFKPGSDFLYSNYGYQLLGAVIESITGKTYQKAMSEFFHQHGLNSTYAETADMIHNDHARYYRFPNATAIHTNIPTFMFDELFAFEGWWPSGGLVSTVQDLVTYGNLMVDAFKKRKNAILSAETLQQIWTRRTVHFSKFPFHPNNDYGYGWFIAYISPTVNPNLKHRNFIWHSGGLVGVTTFLIIYPEEEMVAAVMTNKGYVQGLDNMAIYTAENIFPYC